MDADKRCAPGKKYENKSCFSLKSLQEIAKEYNKKHQDKIIITDDKENLVEQLETKFSKLCSTQTCWLETKILKEIDNNDIHNNTFRPFGPDTKYAWLSTTHINDVINQYQTINNNFLFLGTVPYNFLEIPQLGLDNFNFEENFNKEKYKIGLVINLDEAHQSGSHWVALYADLLKNQVYFFDSVGKPPRKKIKKFINKIIDFLYKKYYKSFINVSNIINSINKLGNKEKRQKYFKQFANKLKHFDIRYNHIQHQFKNSECGVYSINFLIRLVKNESFDNIINDITKDDRMNECRKVYFNNT